MRMPFLMLSCVAAAGASQPAPSLWSTVPASRSATRIESFAVPGVPGDEVVTLVGGREPARSQHAVEALVVGLGLDGAGPTALAEPLAYQTPHVLPPEAIWPGSDGRISALPSDRGRNASSDSLRNPWEIRIRPHREIPESVFVNGGIIGTGPNAVALLNGHVARTGSDIDGYEVALVTYSAVLLRKDGIAYAIPTGRRVAIEAAAR